ncbi:tRNA-specific 2-thiouridylase [Scenedesmus sp. NREL 46B-D3]|nr:tRNA-specific 2-thiouridylase [Scenedesmus sp. NREL 46B-D3]
MQIRPLSGSELQQHEQLPAVAGLDIPPVSKWGNDPFLTSGCEPAAAPLRVAVLVSGGVDSSLALQLVASAGHRPTAFYLQASAAIAPTALGLTSTAEVLLTAVLCLHVSHISDWQIWFQEDFRNFWDACPWEEDLDYAKKVCEALGVPLVVVPLTNEYWQRVVSHSVAEIKAGRTPNPDMLCNSRVKFGAFVEYLEREHGGSFDRIASGHYARIQRPQQQQQQQSSAALSHSHQPAEIQLQDRLGSHEQASSSSSSSSSVVLRLTPDAVKDQTYFLANLSASQLARCMFPLGPFTKPQVRALAAAAGLATSGRKDSQGICFLGKVKFGEFVGQHLGQWPGPLVEEDSGQVVGVHDGYWFYTVGQRGGIKLPGGPWYVTAKDMTHNVVYVSRSYYEQHKRRDAFVCGPFNWLSGLRPNPTEPLMVKNDQGLAAGQYAVFYQDGACLGSAQMLGSVTG